MKEYALFLGCMIPLRLPHLEASARRVLEALDVKLAEMKDTSCCPDPEAIQSLDYATWLTLGARNLTIAEDMNLDIITLCNGCFETLKTVNESLKKDAKLREKTNAVLSRVGRSFKGKTEVKHLIEVLHNDIGPKHIKDSIITDLTKVNAASHPGCHVLRPSAILKVDNPDDPHLMDDLVEATGAHSVSYMKKTLCCGAPIRSVNKDYSLDLVREKTEQLKRVSSDCMVVLCPTCFQQFDTGQIELRSANKADSNIPVLYLPELIGLALGMNSDELGLGMHRVKTKTLLDKISL